MLLQAVLFGKDQRGNQTAALITLGQPQYDTATQVSWFTFLSTCSNQKYQNVAIISPDLTVSKSKLSDGVIWGLWQPTYVG